MATNTIYFNTAGAYNWQAPHGANNVVVQGIGAGGAGANRNSNGAGGGGAGGAYSKLNNFAVTPGNTYALTVGQGGNTNNNSHGTDTTFNGTTLVARGGNTAGRNNATGQTANAGGNSTGDVVYQGGNGAGGNSNGSSFGGGGGSSAGNNGNGIDGSGNNGGITGLPGGAGPGGNGAKTASAVGVAGTFPGGAGGGAHRNNTTNRAGGNGANGQLIITYDYTPNAVEFNGSNQYGSIPNFDGLDGLTDFYLETYIRRRSGAGIYETFTAIDDGTVDYRLTLENDPSGINWGVPYSGDPDAADGYVGSGIFPTDEWVHIGLKHDATLKRADIIVNGRPWISFPGGFPRTGDGSLMGQTNPLLYIAGGPGGAEFTGSIGGFVRLWRRCPTNAEIYRNYQKTLDAAEENDPDLVVNINFGEGSGATLDNDASPGDDMDLYGTPSWIDGPATTAKTYDNPVAYSQTYDSADDAEEDLSTHDTWIDSGDYEFFYDGAIHQSIGLRFPNVQVPAGATIVAAYLHMIAEDDYTSGTTDTVINGEDVDDAAQFTAGSANSDITGRTPTTATVNWGIPGILWRDVVISPDIKDIVQEIVDRGGWASGQAMALIISGSDADLRRFLSTDSNLAGFNGASLEIIYQTGTDTSDERAAKITGKASTSSERAATIRGKSTSNSERDAKITGKNNASSERDAKIHGQDTATSERAAKLTGSTEIAANSERAAKITGKNSTNSERDAKVAGKDTSTSERDAKITGKNSTQSERSAKVTGKDSAASERSATITGKDTASSERDAKVTGKSAATSERSASISGKDTSNSERAAKITGKSTSTSERPAKITGKAATSSERAATVTGKVTTSSERAATLHGQASATAERPAKITGKQTANDERSAKLTGKDTASSERNVKITGKDSSSSERPAKITGKDTAQSERSARLHGKDTSESERPAKVTGKDSASSERPAKVRGKDTASSERGAKTHGKAFSNSERSAKITGKTTSSSERSAKLTGSKWEKGSSTNWYEKTPTPGLQQNKNKWFKKY